MDEASRDTLMRLAAFEHVQRLHEGADPHLVPGSFDRHGRELKPGSRGLATKTVDVDWEKHPGRRPNEMDEEVFTILASMGRDHRQPKC